MVADRKAEAWRLFILASLGMSALLVVGALVFFLQGMSEAQSAFRRDATINYGYRFQDDPRGFQPYVMIAWLIASSSLVVVGARGIWKRRVGSAAGPLYLAALGFAICAVGAIWSSSILHPCIDDRAFYNCEAWVAGDRVALATLLLALAAVVCVLTAAWTDSLAVRMPTMKNSG